MTYHERRRLRFPSVYTDLARGALTILRDVAFIAVVAGMGAALAVLLL